MSRPPSRYCINQHDTFKHGRYKNSACKKCHEQRDRKTERAQLREAREKRASKGMYASPGAPRPDLEAKIALDNQLLKLGIGRADDSTLVDLVELRDWFAAFTSQEAVNG